MRTTMSHPICMLMATDEPVWTGAGTGIDRGAATAETTGGQRRL